MTKEAISLSLVDMTILHTIFGKNNIAITAFLEKLIISSKAILLETTAALQDQEEAVALQYLHRLKGPVGSIGFKKMYALCEKCENHIQQKNWEKAQKNILEISALLDELKIEITP